jgi:hypothetical protein
MTIEQFKLFHIEPPVGMESETPREVKVSLDDIKDVTHN